MVEELYKFSPYKEKKYNQITGEPLSQEQIETPVSKTVAEPKTQIDSSPSRPSYVAPAREETAAQSAAPQTARTLKELEAKRAALQRTYIKQRSTQQTINKINAIGNFAAAIAQLVGNRHGWGKPVQIDDPHQIRAFNTMQQLDSDYTARNKELQEQRAVAEAEWQKALDDDRKQRDADAAARAAWENDLNKRDYNSSLAKQKADAAAPAKAEQQARRHGYTLEEILARDKTGKARDAIRAKTNLNNSKQLWDYRQAHKNSSQAGSNASVAPHSAAGQMTDAEVISYYNKIKSLENKQMYNSALVKGNNGVLPASYRTPGQEKVYRILNSNDYYNSKHKALDPKSERDRTEMRNIVEKVNNQQPWFFGSRVPQGAIPQGVKSSPQESKISTAVNKMGKNPRAAAPVKFN